MPWNEYMSNEVVLRKIRTKMALIITIRNRWLKFPGYIRGKKAKKI